ncbi:MAG: hypothetical protein HYT79_10845 [Elusimicrobia bacterium]|nr:hypothetical protein [Elusimicrobiota bacterium]
MKKTVLSLAPIIVLAVILTLNWLPPSDLLRLWQRRFGYPQEAARAIKDHYRAQSVFLDLSEEPGYGFVRSFFYCPSASTQRASPEDQEQERRKIAATLNNLGLTQDGKMLVVAQCPFSESLPFWNRLFGAVKTHTFGETLVDAARGRQQPTLQQK